MKFICTADSKIEYRKVGTLIKHKEDVIEIVFDKAEKESLFNTISAYVDECIHLGYTSVSDRLSLIETERESLIELLDDEEDICVLLDGSEGSCAIFEFIKQNYKTINIHLIALEPFTFEGKRPNQNFAKALANLDDVKSLCVIDPVPVLGENQQALLEVFSMLGEEIENRIKTLMRQYYYMEEEDFYFYDNNSNEYINANSPDIISEDIVGLIRSFKYPYLPDKEIVERQPLRTDGKAVCNLLKQLRKDFAKSNGIPFETVECDYDGPCAGTCEKCDEELEYLNSQITERNIAFDDVWESINHIKPGYSDTKRFHYKAPIDNTMGYPRR